MWTLFETKGSSDASAESRRRSRRQRRSERAGVGPARAMAVEQSGGPAKGAGRRRMCRLKTRRAWIVGIANRNSTAFGGVEALRRAGAELAVIYRNATAGPLETRAASGIECFRRTAGANSRSHARAPPREYPGCRPSCGVPGRRWGSRAHREYRICRCRLVHRRLSEFE